MINELDIIIISIVLIIEILICLAIKKKRKKKKGFIQFSVTGENSTIKYIGVIAMELTKTQKQLVYVQAFTDEVPPKEAEVQDLKFSSSDETIFTSEPDAENSKAVWVVGKSDGNAKLLVDGDADLGEGVKPIHGELDVTINASPAQEAVGFNFALGEIQEQ